VIAWKYAQSIVLHDVRALSAGTGKRAASNGMRWIDLAVLASSRKEYAYLYCKQIQVSIKKYSI